MKKSDHEPGLNKRKKKLGKKKKKEMLQKDENLGTNPDDLYMAYKGTSRSILGEDYSC